MVSSRKKRPWTAPATMRLFFSSRPSEKDDLGEEKVPGFWPARRPLFLTARRRTEHAV
jgi:hypothetical protein